MKITAIILPSIEEQRAAGDREIIDPAGVKFGNETLPLWRNNSYSVPGDVMGRVENVRLEDGRLVADIEVIDFDFSIGGTVYERDPVGGEATRLNLLTVSMVAKPRRRA